MNMPLEIGLDFGCKEFHPDPKYRQKKSLILEGERFSLHKALSDLSGADVKCHHNQAEKWWSPSARPVQPVFQKWL
jgi:hypothetical protein